LPAIRGDRTQIEQVFVNLCVNARDAMPLGGTLSLSARQRHVDRQQARAHPGVTPGDFVELEVADTGLGMAAEMMDRIFEPFFTTKKLGQGTGLGLSTALGIVRSHGGFMEVTSAVSKGSAFRVFFPAVHNPMPAPERRTPLTLVRGQGQLILLVDDEPAIRQTAARALSDLGYTVVEAQNGEEALTRVEQHRGKLAAIITDLMMPVMDGHEFLARLEKIAPEIPVITASGFDAGAKRSSPNSSSRPHLAKPYTIEALSERLAAVLSSR
jgi:CheY-like chemotaxis protein